jgi:hypothetical protein
MWKIRVIMTAITTEIASKKPLLTVAKDKTGAGWAYGLPVAYL